MTCFCSLYATWGGHDAQVSSVAQSHPQHEFWKLGVGLAAAAAATAAVPPLSAQCTPSIEKPIKLPVRMFTVRMKATSQHDCAHDQRWINVLMALHNAKETTNEIHISRLQDLSTGGISLRGSTTPSTTQRSIVFVLGGPGSGKGTQVSTARCDARCHDPSVD